jgi:DNA polymerase-3 subunit delta'
MVTAAADSAAGNPVQPWLKAPLHQLLRAPQGHALLLQGPAGVGQFELAMAAAQAWLCEQEGQPSDPGHAVACGVCASCRLFESHTHPDLLLLLPDALRESLGWAAGDEGEGASGTEKASSAKPSKDIKVEAVRRAVAFAQTTSARGRAKVLVVHPAERMNAVAANALLKTLEEPPGQARFIISSAAPDALLPTIRSRCQAFSLPLPDARHACAWLAEQGVPQPEVLLAATGGQPQDALAWSREGVTAQAWLALPEQLRQGQGAAFANWPLPRIVQTLQKVCHDAMRLTAGASPRYFAAGAWAAPASFDLPSLTRWSRELQAEARHAEHPWSQPLAVQALVNAAAVALKPADKQMQMRPAPRQSPAAAGIR